MNVFYFESIKIDEVSAECGVCGGDQEQQHILLVNLQLKCRTIWGRNEVTKIVRTTMRFADVHRSFNNK